MINERREAQNEMEVVMLEQLVPQDHLLRKIDKYIDFSFIRELTKDLYCHTNGRPAVDPVVLFKMLFIGYLYGIRSERQLVKDIEVNLAYRWFLGYSITEKIPDSSTISQNRIRRFKGTDIPQRIFDNIVLQAMEKGLVGGKILYSDSTHIKANANKRKFEKIEIEVTPKEYIDQLDIDVNLDRENHNKKPLKPRKKKEETKEIKKSTTDPDSGYMMRDNKPEGFFYLDHRTVDSKNNIIMDVHVTPGNVSDSEPILKRIDRIEETFNIKPKYLGLDAGYSTNPIFKGITDRDIIPVIAYRRSPHKKGMYTKNKYIYDYDKDIYICPNNVALIYKTTTREGYKEYICFEEICMCCPHKDKCLGEKSKYKTIRRHVWEDHKDDNKNFLRTEKGKGIYDRRKETVERSFADSKNLHGLRYARFRGREKVSEQCLLTAAVQNMKKIATRLSLLFSYYIINFDNIFNLKFYPQLIIEKPSVFKQWVFQQTEIMSMTLLMTFMLSTVSFATNLTLAQQLQQRLINLGIPNSYRGNIVEYLQKIKINEDQFKSINAKIDEAVALANGATDISIIDEEVKSKIKNLASESASILGLRLTFGKDSKGVTTATILDTNGNNILSLNTFNVIDLVQDIDPNEIKEVVIIITEFSNNPEKNKFDPISGELNKTGTNIGNVMAVGFGLIALSGAIFITSKRVLV